MSRQPDIAWVDRDGDECHITLGQEFYDYTTQTDSEGNVGVIEVRSQGDREWNAVFLPRERANELYDALGVVLKEGVT